jgi:hypothetical protein
MSKEQDDKRAKIIANQQAREEADRASGRLPALPSSGRSNWAASPSSRARRRPGRPPKNPFSPR